ncbi:hypothetical protein MRX96_027464 [Rhipicephalus microplus]
MLIKGTVVTGVLPGEVAVKLEPASVSVSVHNLKCARTSLSRTRRKCAYTRRRSGGGYEPVLEWEREEVLLRVPHLDRDRDLDFLPSVEPPADMSPSDDDDCAG